MDLPLPVGPVTNISPYGFAIACLKLPRSFSENPILSISNDIAPLSSILSTAFSPNTVGTTDTLKSIGLSSTFTVKPPSCGSLFSAISIFESIFILDIRAGKRCCDGGAILCNIPSILKRTFIFSLKGSMCISLARSFTA